MKVISVKIPEIVNHKKIELSDVLLDNNYITGKFVIKKKNENFK